MQLGEASVLRGQLQRRRPVDVLAERLQRPGAHEPHDLGSQGDDCQAVSPLVGFDYVLDPFKQMGLEMGSQCPRGKAVGPELTEVGSGIVSRERGRIVVETPLVSLVEVCSTTREAVLEAMAELVDDGVYQMLFAAGRHDPNLVGIGVVVTTPAMVAVLDTNVNRHKPTHSPAFHMLPSSIEASNHSVLVRISDVSMEY